MNNISLL